MNLNLLIVGANGHGKCCHEIAEGMNNLNKIDFVDNIELKILHKDVIGKLNDLRELRDECDCAFIAFGDNKTRKIINGELNKYTFVKVNIVDSTTFVSSFSKLGKGVVIFPDSPIEADSELKDGFVISAYSTIHHETKIEEYSLICSQSVARPLSIVESYSTIQSGTMIDGGN